MYYTSRKEGEHERSGPPNRKDDEETYHAAHPRIGGLLRFGFPFLHVLRVLDIALPALLFHTIRALVGSVSLPPEELVLVL